jgi:hypothetical protein
MDKRPAANQEPALYSSDSLRHRFSTLCRSADARDASYAARAVAPPATLAARNFERKDAPRTELLKVRLDWAEGLGSVSE